MTTYGLTAQGIRTKRLLELLEENKTAWRAAFGNVDTDANSVGGQIIGVQSKPAADVWEALGVLYTCLSPETAEGVYLDYLLALNGLERLPAIPTQVWVGFLGDENTVIPQGYIAESSVTGKRFKPRSADTISCVGQTLLYLEISMMGPNASIIFDIIYGGVTYTFGTNSGSTPDLTVITDTLVDAVNNEPDCRTSATKLAAGIIKLTAISGTFTLDINTEALLRYWKPIMLYSEERAGISSGVGSIVIDVTPQSGLDAIYNFEEGVRGRGVETDAEARLRRRQSLQVVGAGTLDAMIARIRAEVENVTYVSGYENREDITVDGMPPHSVQMIVLGGTPHDIATKIWEVKGGGIQTYGNSYHDVEDSNGDIQRIYFSIPVTRYGWVRCIYELYAEEDFPDDGETLIAQALLAYGNTVTIGQDIVTQRFIGPVYGISGVGHVVLSCAITTTPQGSPSWVTNDRIPVSASDIVVFDIARITVQEEGN